MFLRKLTVLAVPPALCLAVCLLLPLAESIGGFFARVLVGFVLGIALAVLLPLAGATKKREPFAGLMAIPAALILLIVLVQYLLMQGALQSQLLQFLMPVQPNIVLVECAFAAFMLTTCVRTRA